MYSDSFTGMGEAVVFQRGEEFAQHLFVSGADHMIVPVADGQQVRRLISEAAVAPQCAEPVGHLPARHGEVADPHGRSAANRFGGCAAIDTVGPGRDQHGRLAGVGGDHVGEAEDEFARAFTRVGQAVRPVDDRHIAALVEHVLDVTEAVGGGGRRSLRRAGGGTRLDRLEHGAGLSSVEQGEGGGEVRGTGADPGHREGQHGQARFDRQIDRAAARKRER